MKKRLLTSALLATSLTLAGCNKTPETPPTPIADTNSCQQAIQTYLADNTNTTLGEAASDGKMASVHYIGRFVDGETDDNGKIIFDTSIESVAKGCDSYQEGRDYQSGLPFVLGAGQMIPGFEQAVTTMKVGETKTVTLAPKDAYGEWSEDNLIEIKKSDLPEGDRKAGDSVPAFFGPLEIIEVKDETIILDGNPPLAGKTLVFDITLIDLTDAPAPTPEVAPVEESNDESESTEGEATVDTTATE